MSRVPATDPARAASDRSVRSGLLSPSYRTRTLRWSAALVLVAGYLDLIAGGATIAPMLLVAGYLVLVPLALLVP